MKKSIQHSLKQVPLEALVIALVFLISLFTFSYIVHEAVYEQEALFDRKVMRFIAGHSTPAFIDAMKRITFFGSTDFLLPAYIALIGWHIYKKRTQNAIDIAVIAVSSTAMMFALKQFFHRQRPQLPIIKDITGYSFPSGHSLSSFIFCSVLVYMTWKGNLQAPWKYALILLLIVYALLIGLSRVVLNVHYATDVIGGFCLGMAWAILSFGIIKKIRKSSPARIEPVS